MENKQRNYCNNHRHLFGGEQTSSIDEWFGAEDICSQNAVESLSVKTVGYHKITRASRIFLSHSKDVKKLV